MKNLILRSYLPGDESSILELFKAVFEKKMSHDYWNWRFKENPFDDPQILMAFDGKKLVGHYAVSPIRVCFNGEEALFGHSMTTMTHPDYQGLGLFTQLASSLYQELQKKGYRGVLGFPNSNSYYGFLTKLQWQPIGTIPFLVCNQPLDNFDKDITISYSKGVDEDLAKLNYKRISKYYSLAKSYKYLKWRFENHPESNYKFLTLSFKKQKVAQVIFKEFSKGASQALDLLEIVTSSDSWHDHVLKYMRAEFTPKGYILTTWKNIHSPNYAPYVKNHFTPEGNSTYFMGTVFGIIANSFYDQRQWEFAMGDSDVF
jgi:predicted N-acetyltransferase YhbS